MSVATENQLHKTVTEWCFSSSVTIHVETMEAYTLWWNGGTPLWIIKPYYNKWGKIWKAEHDLSPLSEFM